MGGGFNTVGSYAAGPVYFDPEAVLVGDGNGC